MELLKSLGLFLLGIVKRIYWLLPALLLDPFDLAERLFGVSYQVPQWIAWLLAGIGFFIAGLLTYHDTRKHIAREEVGPILAKLTNTKVVIAGRNDNMATLLSMLIQPFAYGVRERNIEEALSQLLTESEPSEILAKLRLAGIINSEYIDPAPGSPVASRKSINDLPYHFYAFTELGRHVANRLAKDSY